MQVQDFIWPFFLTLVTLVSSQSSIDTPHSADLHGSGGLKPQFPLGPLPVPIPAPGFGGQSDSATAKLVGRTSTLVRCGPNFGTCAEGFCCSPHGKSEMGDSVSVITAHEFTGFCGK